MATEPMKASRVEASFVALLDGLSIPTGELA